VSIYRERVGDVASRGRAKRTQSSAKGHRSARREGEESETCHSARARVHVGKQRQYLVVYVSKTDGRVKNVTAGGYYLKYEMPFWSSWAFTH